MVSSAHNKEGFLIPSQWQFEDYCYWPLWQHWNALDCRVKALGNQSLNTNHTGLGKMPKRDHRVDSFISPPWTHHYVHSMPSVCPSKTENHWSFFIAKPYWKGSKTTSLQPRLIHYPNSPKLALPCIRQSSVPYPLNDVEFDKQFSWKEENAAMHSVSRIKVPDWRSSQLYPQQGIGTMICS